MRREERGRLPSHSVLRRMLLCIHANHGISISCHFNRGRPIQDCLPHIQSQLSPDLPVLAYGLKWLTVIMSFINIMYIVVHYVVNWACLIVIVKSEVRGVQMFWCKSIDTEYLYSVYVMLLSACEEQPRVM